MRPLVFVVLAVLAAGCGSETEPAPEPTPSADAPPVADARQTVYRVVAETPELSTLAGLVETAGLRETLADPDAALTLFAPTDAAFDALGPDALNALRANPEAARALLLDHALSARLLSADVFDDLAIETLAGSEVTFAGGADGLTVRDGTGVAASVVQPDLDADNGVVHLIDAVLSGPNAP